MCNRGSGEVRLRLSLVDSVSATLFTEGQGMSLRRYVLVVSELTAEEKQRICAPNTRP